MENRKINELQLCGIGTSGLLQILNSVTNVTSFPIIILSILNQPNFQWFYYLYF